MTLCAPKASTCSTSGCRAGMSPLALAVAGCSKQLRIEELAVTKLLSSWVHLIATCTRLSISECSIVRVRDLAAAEQYSLMVTYVH